MRRLAILAGILALSCDDKPATPEPKPSTTASTSVPTPAASTPPPAPAKPVVTIEEASAQIGPDRVEWNGPDLKGRLGLATNGKPIAGEAITVIAGRNVKVPNVAAVFSALSAAKAKSILLKTQKRDNQTAEITFELAPKRFDCAGVGFVAKDVAINAWTLGGGAAAARFTKGMAGPDITRGSEGVRKLVNACDAPYFAVAGDENVTWGLLVDLALAVRNPDDAGAPTKARDVVLLSKATPGRKVDDLE